MSRWIAAAGALAFVALLTLAALALAPAAAPPGDALRVGVNTLPVSLGDPFRGNGRPGTFVWSAIFDALTRLDDRGRLVPALALTWDAPTPTTWRFVLRPGIRYSNGRPFDARAAARVLNWLATPAGRKTVIGAELRSLANARAVAPLTLEITTATPDPILPKRLVAAFMVEPELWARLGPKRFALAPVGTGPFRLVRWDERRRRVEFIANARAWEPPHVASMVFVELPDAAVRTQALLSRDVDIAPVEIEETDRLRDRGFPIGVSPTMSVMSIAFVNQRATPGPLQDVRVRQALNYAVDKTAIARVLLRGLGRAAGQPAPHVSTGYDPAVGPYPYDPARARALLAAAGYPHGFALAVDVQVNAFPADALIFQTVAHDLRQVGVVPQLRVIALSEYLRHLSANSWSADAFAASWNSAPYNDATRSMEGFSCKRPKPFFCDKPLAGALSRATAIRDDAARGVAMAGLARAYHAAAPALFLVEQIDLFAHAPRVAGVHVQNRVPVFRDIVIRHGDPHP